MWSLIDLEGGVLIAGLPWLVIPKGSQSQPLLISCSSREVQILHATTSILPLALVTTNKGSKTEVLSVRGSHCWGDYTGLFCHIPLLVALTAA